MQSAVGGVQPKSRHADGAAYETERVLIGMPTHRSAFAST